MLPGAEPGHFLEGMMSRDQQMRASCLRQEMTNLLAEIESLSKCIMGRQPMVKGSLYARRRACGRAGCRCQKGSLHVSEAFSYSQSGKTRHVPLEGKDCESLRRAVDSYRCFRRARAQMARAWVAVLARVDELEKTRRIPWEQALSRHV
jgi:hypothetical protein